MKHTMCLMRFSFDKIVNGTKRVEVRLFDAEHQKIKLNDVIEFVCHDTGESVLCLVRGILVFERCDDLVALLPSKIFGYDNKEEVRIRLNRRFNFEEQLINHVLGIIIMPLQVNETVHEVENVHIEEGRDSQREKMHPFKQTFSEAKQMLREEKIGSRSVKILFIVKRRVLMKRKKLLKLRDCVDAVWKMMVANSQIYCGSLK